MSRFNKLCDKKWELLEPLFAKYQKERSGRGRSRLHNDRHVLDGILWVLSTGARWEDMPDRYPSYSTCYRRFCEWTRAGVFRLILIALTRFLEDKGVISLAECYIDGTFSPAKRGCKSWKDQTGKGHKDNGDC